MEFDYSCFRRALNDVLMNCVMNHKFHKTGDYLDKQSNHCVLDVFSVMISSVLFFSDVRPPRCVSGAVAL
jgi:hypothetical protein